MGSTNIVSCSLRLTPFQAAFGPHAESIVGDIPNYTSVQPTIQISQVKIASEPVATQAQAASERGPAR
jgi:hypothetical protein